MDLGALCEGHAAHNSPDRADSSLNPQQFASSVFFCPLDSLALQRYEVGRNVRWPGPLPHRKPLWWWELGGSFCVHCYPIIDYLPATREEWSKDHVLKDLVKRHAYGIVYIKSIFLALPILLEKFMPLSQHFPHSCRVAQSLFFK